MRLELVQLKCDRPAHGGGDSVAIEAVVDGQDSAHPRQIWEAHEFLGPRPADDGSTSTIPDRHRVGRTIIFSGNVQLRLVAAARPSASGGPHVATQSVSSTVTDRAVRPYPPRLRFTMDGTSGLYTLTYVVSEPTAETGVCDDELSCSEIVITSRSVREHPVARDDEQQLCIDVSAECAEAIRYPRYTVFRNPDLWIWDAARHRRGRRFTRERWNEYLTCKGRSEPEFGNRQTWGPLMEVDNLPTCHISGNELQLGTANTWNWRVFNLLDPPDCPVQPNWLGYLERTLMFFPIEHLRAVNIHTIVFDFRIGTSRLGPRARVGSGGINWQARADSRGDQRELPALGATFAALNRGWYRLTRMGADAGGISGTDAEIDDWYSTANFQSHGSRVLYTLYHEFGHLHHPSGANTPERQRLFWSFFWALVAHQRYRGASKAWGEGFSEAYRYRLMGRAAPALRFTAADRDNLVTHNRDSGGRDMRSYLNATDRANLGNPSRIPVGSRVLGPLVDAALDDIGMPTRDSVNAVRSQIADRVGGPTWTWRRSASA